MLLRRDAKKQGKSVSPAHLASLPFLYLENQCDQQSAKNLGFIILVRPMLLRRDAKKQGKRQKSTIARQIANQNDETQIHCSLTTPDPVCVRDVYCVSPAHLASLPFLYLENQEMAGTRDGQARHSIRHARRRDRG
jgi:hypothetical protein